MPKTDFSQNEGAESVREIALTIHDQAGRVYSIHFTRGACLWLMDVIAADGRRVGRLMATEQVDGTLLLGDLTIGDVLPVCTPWWRRCVQCIGGHARMHESFRGRGLGSALLDAFLCEARQAGVRSITGYLVPKDLRAWPALPEWYARRGFKLSPSTETKSAGPHNLLIRKDF